MRRMRFDHDRAAGGQGRSRIAARNGERQRKVARTENGDRPDWNQHTANVRFRRRLAVRNGAVDTGTHPGAFTNEGSEELELVQSAAALRYQPFGNRQGGFSVRRL